MKRKLFLAFAVCVIAGSAWLRADDLPWQFEYDKALEEAKDSHKPVLLDFSASWCGPCRMMETTTFANAGVQGTLNGYILVKIDIDHDAALAARYRVQAVPTCILLNQFGEQVDRRTGYTDAARFSQWLAASANSAVAKAAEPKSVIAARGIKQLGQSLELPDAVARDRALAELLVIYCAQGAHAGDGDAKPAEKPAAQDPLAAASADDDGGSAKLVEEELGGFVQRHPGPAVRQLNDARLAVRILFATLFVARFGPDFQFDPWASANARAELAENLARRLPEPEH